MKVTIELEVSNLQDLAGMIAGAADGVLANTPADQELGKVETAREVKATAKKAEPKTEAKTKPAAKRLKPRLRQRISLNLSLIPSPRKSLCTPRRKSRKC